MKHRPSPSRRAHPSRRAPARGVMLVALLIAMLFGAVLSLASAETWSMSRQREREVELLFVGDQYRQAIRRYYFAVPANQARMLPLRLEDLLSDTRFPVPLQHLRKLYPDPITGSTDWGLVLQGQRIVGVYSPSDDKPVKQTGFDALHSGFEYRGSYREWAFVFVPPLARRR